MVVLALQFTMVWSSPLVMDRRRVVSRSGWAWSVVWTVWGERASRAGVRVNWGGSWMGASLGNLFDVL
jgi:hypothetical protein